MCIASSSAATPSRSSSNVLLRGDGAGLRLKATDLDIEVTETIDADAAQGGATTVPAHVIYDIVRKLPDGAQVSLETAGDAGQMQIRSGRSRFMLQTLPESDFPDLAAGEMPLQVRAAAGRSAPPHRQDPVRDLDRGDALLPQRHLLPHHRERRRDHAARGRDRRASPRARRDPGAAGRRGHARRDRAAQGRRRDPEARRGRRGGRRRSSCPPRRSASRSAAWC